MSFRARFVAAAALAMAGFLLAPAVAQAATHPVQVPGKKLKTALLPASTFGPDFRVQFVEWTAPGLWHQRAKDHVASMSCGKFEDGVGIGRFGESGAALSLVVNQDTSAFPNTEFYYDQSVYQFPTTKAAATFYSQVKAKYAKCKDFTENVPASSVPGSGKMETTLMSMSKAKVARDQAFQATQDVTLSEFPGFALTLNTLVTLQGADVFTIVSFAGTNDPISSGTMLKFIGRVKKLH
jgi:hypothetical protein